MFMLALACRVIVFAGGMTDSSRLFSAPDSDEYVAIARNIAAGHGFSAADAPPYRPDVRRTPVYPVLIASVLQIPHAGFRTAAAVNLLAGSVTAALTYCLGLRLFGPGPALTGGVLMALDLTSITYSVLLLTETSFTLLLVLAVLILADRSILPGHAVRAGLLLGVATLCRPIGLLLGPALLPVVAWRPSGWRAAARAYVLLNVMFAAMVLPWIVRNLMVAGVLTLSSIGAVNLYFHRAAAVEARLEARNVETVRAGWEKRFNVLSADWSERAKIEWLTRQAGDVIRSNPGVYLQAYAGGLARMAEPDTTELRQVIGVAENARASRALDAVAALQLLIVYAAAGVGLWCAARDAKSRRALLVPLTLIVYFILTAGPEVYARFRVPIMPYIALLSGVGVHGLRARRRERA